MGQWHDGKGEREEALSIFQLLQFLLGCPAETAAEEKVPAVFSLSLYKARTPLRGAGIPKSVRLREFTVL